MCRRMCVQACDVQVCLRPYLDVQVYACPYVRCAGVRASIRATCRRMCVRIRATCRRTCVRTCDMRAYVRPCVRFAGLIPRRAGARASIPWRSGVCLLYTTQIYTHVDGQLARITSLRAEKAGSTVPCIRGSMRSRQGKTKDTLDTLLSAVGKPQQALGSDHVVCLGLTWYVFLKVLGSDVNTSISPSILLDVLRLIRWLQSSIVQWSLVLSRQWPTVNPWWKPNSEIRISGPWPTRRS